MKRGFRDLAIRYFLLIIIGIFSLQIFYFIFSPLTVYPVYSLLNFIFGAGLIGTTILIKNIPIEIIGACVAGSAYYLLLILNLATPKIKWKKRTGILLFSFLSLLLVNILRIFLLSILLVRGFSYFDFTHKFFWYAGSTIFVVGIWFLSVKLFKIKEIPFYSDIISLISKKEKKKIKKKKN